MKISTRRKRLGNPTPPLLWVFRSLSLLPFGSSLSEKFLYPDWFSAHQKCFFRTLRSGLKKRGAAEFSIKPTSRCYTFVSIWSLIRSWYIFYCLRGVFLFNMPLWRVFCHNHPLETQSGRGRVMTELGGKVRELSSSYLKKKGFVDLIRIYVQKSSLGLCRRWTEKSQNGDLCHKTDLQSFSLPVVL